MRSLPLLAVAMLLACSPSDEGQGASPAAGATTPKAAEQPAAPALPRSFSGTAWRALAADGARFTTYLDAGGRYRDVRNGDPWQEGTWQVSAAATRELCFLPDDPVGRQTCWQPDKVDDDALFLVNAAGRRIELRAVEYVPPAPTVAEDEAA